MTDKLNLIDTIAKDDKLSVFSRAMDSSGANASLTSDGSFTVFAPTNDAFGKVPDDKMNALLSQPGQADLKALLMYHILPTKIDAVNLSSIKSAQTLSGKEINFSDSGGIKVNGSGMQARNIAATNGVIHALDTVLTAPAATAPATAPAVGTTPAVFAAPAAVPAPTAAPAVATAPAVTAGPVPAATPAPAAAAASPTTVS